MSFKSTVSVLGIALATLLSIEVVSNSIHMTETAFADDLFDDGGEHEATEAESGESGVMTLSSDEELVDLFGGGAQDSFSRGGFDDDDIQEIERIVDEQSVEKNKQLKVFSLQYLSAAEAATVLSQLYGPELGTVSAVEASNQLIILGTGSALAVAEKLLMRLDQKRPPRNSSLAKPTAAGWNLSAATELDHKMREFAASYHEKSKTLGARHPALEAIRKDVTKLVSESFDERQHASTQRIAQLERRLAMLKKKVEQRERTKKQAIRQRVDVLLSGHERLMSTFRQNANSQFDAAVRVEQQPVATNGVFASRPQTPYVQGGSPLDLVAAFIHSEAEIQKSESDLLNASRKLEKTRSLLQRSDTEDLGQVASSEAELKSIESSLKTAKRLLDLMKTRIRAKRATLENALQRAEVTMSSKQRELERVELLKDKNVISSAEQYQIRADAQQAKLELEQAKENLSTFLKEIDDIQYD